MFGFKKIIENYDIFIFISPHLDDAVLSCGQFIKDLAEYKKQVTVISVFTKAKRNTISPQAIDFLKNCRYKSATKLYNDFRNEDINVLKYLQVKHIHLNFTDAAWRIDKNKKPIYPNVYSQFSDNVSENDKPLTNLISSKIITLLKKQKGRYLILAPLSVGGHADHVIIQKIICKLNCPKLFWEDFPYNTNRKFLKTFFEKHKEFKLLFKLHGFGSSKKDKAIRLYKSQIGSLFPSGKIPHISEKYYIQKNSELL
jgi:LmbE family N-acetylglucosaminyl deacetylase